MCIRDRICDGLGSSFAALFGVLPNTSFSQNVGLVAMTKVVNRMALASGAILLILCGLIPVSYTHLDVYKRQLCSCPVSAAKLTGALQGLAQQGRKPFGIYVTSQLCS